MKLEVHRTANEKPLLYPEDHNIRALVSDFSARDVPSHLAHAHINDIEAVASLVLQLATQWPERAEIN